MQIERIGVYRGYFVSAGAIENVTQIASTLGMTNKLVNGLEYFTKK